ncbi:hypothetical protein CAUPRSCDRAFT_12523, partial [Caulochytrium protostelioides]
MEAAAATILWSSTNAVNASGAATTETVMAPGGTAASASASAGTMLSEHAMFPTYDPLLAALSKMASPKLVSFLRHNIPARMVDAASCYPGRAPLSHELIAEATTGIPSGDRPVKHGKSRSEAGSDGRVRPTRDIAYLFATPTKGEMARPFQTSQHEVTENGKSSGSRDGAAASSASSSSTSSSPSSKPRSTLITLDVPVNEDGQVPPHAMERSIFAIMEATVALMIVDHDAPEWVRDIRHKYGVFVEYESGLAKLAFIKSKYRQRQRLQQPETLNNVREAAGATGLFRMSSYTLYQFAKSPPYSVEQHTTHLPRWVAFSQNPFLDGASAMPLPPPHPHPPA